MSRASLTPDQTSAMIRFVAGRVIEAEPELTDADRALGDGDHGLGMQRGMRAVQESLESERPASIAAVFTATGTAMMSSMGGASGAVFGTLFRAGGKALAGRESFDSADLAEFLREASAAVMARGGARPGDKTMVDALLPAAERAAESTGRPLAEAMDAAASAAEAGRDASRNMVAALGRAQTLGSASLGHPDAGACSVAIIFRAMADFLSDPSQSKS